LTGPSDREGLHPKKPKSKPKRQTKEKKKKKKKEKKKIFGK
jgi:hypothetical protein